jgi:serine acetyltransferase
VLVGANSTVTKNSPHKENAVMIGSPVKIVGGRAEASIAAGSDNPQVDQRS